MSRYMAWSFTHDMTGVVNPGEKVCFRTQGVKFCRCPLKDGVFSVKGFSMYPQLGMMGSRETGLLDIKHVPWGECFWQEVLRQPYGVRAMSKLKAPTIPLGWGYFIHMFFTGMDRDGAPMPCSWVCRGFGCRNHKSLTAHLWIIQRAVRRFIQSRREARSLAVFMAGHERLGACSLLSLIPQDVLAHKILGWDKCEEVN